MLAILRSAASQSRSPLRMRMTHWNLTSLCSTCITIHPQTTRCHMCSTQRTLECVSVPQTHLSSSQQRNCTEVFASHVAYFVSSGRVRRPFRMVRLISVLGRWQRRTGCGKLTLHGYNSPIALGRSCRRRDRDWSPQHNICRKLPRRQML